MEQTKDDKMAPVHIRMKVALAGVVLSTTSIVSAQQAPAQVVEAKAARQVVAAAQRSARGVRSLINGIALNGNKSPVVNAPIRLRNLKANQIEQTTVSNELGEFTFAVQPDVPYVVEVADQAGRIIAVGDVIVTDLGDVAGAVVTLPSRLPAMSNVFGDSASSVISAATGMGLTVVDPTLPKVTPRR